MTLQEKILNALSELLKGGDTHITRYKIAKKADVDTSAVYKFFKNLKV